MATATPLQLKNDLTIIYITSMYPSICEMQNVDYVFPFKNLWPWTPPTWEILFSLDESYLIFVLQNWRKDKLGKAYNQIYYLLQNLLPHSRNMRHLNSLRTIIRHEWSWRSKYLFTFADQGNTFSLQACTQMFTSAYTDCSNGINKAYSDCKSTLDSIPVIGRRKRDVEVAMERLLRQENLFTALQKFRDIHIKGINPIKGTSNQTDVPLEEEDVARFWEWYIEKGDRRYDSSLNEDVLAIRNVTGMAEGIFENDIHFPHHR